MSGLQPPIKTIVYNRDEMRKEVLLAVIFGIILGGVILYGINLANKSVNSASNTDKSTKAQTTPTPTEVVKKPLEITSPANHLVTVDKVVTISGKASPNSTLAIVSESEDLIIEASQEGTFSAKINLISGENSILITLLLADSKTITETLTIIQTASLPE